MWEMLYSAGLEMWWTIQFYPTEATGSPGVKHWQQTSLNLWAIQKTENMEHNQEHKISELFLTNELLEYYIH